MLSFGGKGGWSVYFSLKIASTLKVDYIKIIPDHIDQDSLDKIFSIVESDSVSVTHQSETILFLNKS